jgi:uncharacterized protein (TIGR01244 family)
MTMDNVKTINEALAIAGQVTSEQLQQAVQAGFKSVLNLRSPAEPTYWSEEKAHVEALGLVYANIPTPKVEELTENDTTQVLQAIDELPKPVLVHCASSLRVKALTTLYLAVADGLAPEQACEKAHEFDFDCNTYPQVRQLLSSSLS